MFKRDVPNAGQQLINTHISLSSVSPEPSEQFITESDGQLGVSSDSQGYNVTQQTSCVP